MPINPDSDADITHAHLHVVTTDKLVFVGNPKLRCPKCSRETASPPVGEGITVALAPFSGVYCLWCYAEWLAAHFPKLEPVAPIDP